MKQRLGASKQARLEEVKGGSDDDKKNRQEFAEAAVRFAEGLAEPPPAPARKGKAQARFAFTQPVRVIGIVVNRVDTARRVYDLLARPTGEPAAHDAILLTGRIRPYDRDRLLRDWFPYMQAEKDRDPPPKGRLYVVATQTVEVGANLSFDALVTEAAPIDALRQRFGRLDRLGLRGTSHAVIIARKDLLKTKDPVYGNKSKDTWDWLGQHLDGPTKAKYIDFGIDAMARHDRAELEKLCAPSAHAPVMMPAHVDDWTQTSVAPVPDPDPALFLHGPQSGPADVSVVWRADVTEESLGKEVGKNDARDARRVVALVPPVSMEALSLPIWHVRNWLRDRSASADFSDLEGESEPEADRRREERKCDPFLVWRGSDRDDGTEASTDPGDIYPGCTIVVPIHYGGCDKFGWKPDHKGDVDDVADDCSWRAKRRPVLRIHPDSGVQRVALAAWEVSASVEGKTLGDSLASAARPGEESDEKPTRAALAALRSWPDLPGWLRSAASDKRTRAIPYPQNEGVVILMPFQRPESDTEIAESDGPASDDGTSFIGGDGYVYLEDHCRNVRKRFDDFARDLVLDDAFREPASRASLLHDAGKADPRFQLWLYGSEAAAARNDFKLIQ